MTLVATLCLAGPARPADEPRPSALANAMRSAVGSSAGTELAGRALDSRRSSGQVDWRDALGFTGESTFWRGVAGTLAGNWAGARLARVAVVRRLTLFAAARLPVGGLLVRLLPESVAGALGAHLATRGGVDASLSAALAQGFGAALGATLASCWFPGAGWMGELIGSIAGSVVADQLTSRPVAPVPGGTRKEIYQRYLEAARGGRLEEAKRLYSAYVRLGTKARE